MTPDRITVAVARALYAVHRRRWRIDLAWDEISEAARWEWLEMAEAALAAEGAAA